LEQRIEQNYAEIQALNQTLSKRDLQENERDEKRNQLKLLQDESHQLRNQLDGY
jgi:hypothetical protein